MTDYQSSNHQPSDYQPSLFSASELRGCYAVTPVGTDLSATAIVTWKQRIFQYQQQVVVQPPQQQRTLFDLGTFDLGTSDLGTSDLGTIASEPVAESAALDTLDPFSLPRQNTEFWRWKVDEAGIAALYFVIDYTVPILLYVGETVKSNQRWKGEHDCKRYLLNYRQYHYQHQLDSTLGIAFWAKAPQSTRSRQQLESSLIYKWRSPFNKENWKFWGTPFINSA